jgi:hypothetical protein
VTAPTHSVTVEDGLREALRDASRGQIRFPRDFQGFPGTVHGGAVAALFHRLTLPRSPVQLTMELLRGVPTETPLRLVTGGTGREARLALEQSGRRVAQATLSREDVPSAADPTPVLVAWGEHGASQGEMPGTTTCLACGSANPLGLGVRFLFTDRLLWREFTPRATYRGSNGSAHPALATIILDELGWWLGALAQGECGVTTEVAVTLLRPLPFGPLLALGDRAAVRPDEDPRGRYCRAVAFLCTSEGEPLGVGVVRFAGSRAYTRRLLEPFLETTDLSTLTRFFPTAGRFAARDGRG